MTHLEKLGGTRRALGNVADVAGDGGITAHTVNIYAGKPPATPHPTPFPAVEPKDGLARFRALGAPLGIRDDPFFVGARNNVVLAAGPAMWLRLMPPVDPGKRWTSYDLKTVVGHGLTLQPLLWGSISGYGGLYRIRAEDGVGCCSLLSRDARETSSVAFAFETGEVWAIDTSLLGSYPTDLLVIEIEKLCSTVSRVCIFSRKFRLTTAVSVDRRPYRRAEPPATKSPS